MQKLKLASLIAVGLITLFTINFTVSVVIPELIRGVLEAGLPLIITLCLITYFIVLARVKLVSSWIKALYISNVLGGILFTVILVWHYIFYFGCKSLRPLGDCGEGYFIIVYLAFFISCILLLIGFILFLIAYIKNKRLINNG